MSNLIHLELGVRVLSSWLLLGILISGCATGTQLSSFSACWLDGKPHVSGSKYAFIDMTKSSDGVVKLLDGKPFLPSNCNYNLVALEEGEHIINFSYRKNLSVLGPSGSAPISLTFSAKAGETYYAVVKKSGIPWKYNCHIKVASTGITLS